MCQLLRKLGAKTIGTAGGPEKCALAKENGADVLIDYKSEQGPHWLETVKKVTGGAGVAVVYDSGACCRTPPQQFMLIIIF